MATRASGISCSCEERSRTPDERADLLPLPHRLALLRKRRRALSRVGGSEHRMNRLTQSTLHLRVLNLFRYYRIIFIDFWITIRNCSIAVFNINGNQLTDDIAPRLMSLVRRVETALGGMTGAAHDMETRPWSVSAN